MPNIAISYILRFIQTKEIDKIKIYKNSENPSVLSDL